MKSLLVLLIIINAVTARAGEVALYVVMSDFGQGAARIDWGETNGKTKGIGELLIDSYGSTWESAPQNWSYNKIQAVKTEDGGIVITLTNRAGTSKKKLKRCEIGGPYDPSIDHCEEFEQQDWFHFGSTLYFADLAKWNGWTGIINAVDANGRVRKINYAMLELKDPIAWRKFYLGRRLDSIKRDKDLEDFETYPVMTGRIIVESAVDPEILRNATEKLHAEIMMCGWDLKTFEIVCLPGMQQHVAHELKKSGIVKEAFVPNIEGRGAGDIEEQALLISRDALPDVKLVEGNMKVFAAKLIGGFQSSVKRPFKATEPQMVGHCYSCVFNIQGAASDLSQANVNEWERATVYLQLFQEITASPNSSLTLNIQVFGIEHCKWPTDKVPDGHWVESTDQKRNDGVLRRVANILASQTGAKFP